MIPVAILILFSTSLTRRGVDAVFRRALRPYDTTLATPHEESDYRRLLPEAEVLVAFAISPIASWAHSMWHSGISRAKWLANRSPNCSASTGRNPDLLDGFPFSVDAGSGETGSRRRETAQLPWLQTASVAGARRLLDQERRFPRKSPRRYALWLEGRTAQSRHGRFLALSERAWPRCRTGLGLARQPHGRAYLTRLPSSRPRARSLPVHQFCAAIQMTVGLGWLQQSETLFESVQNRMGFARFGMA